MKKYYLLIFSIFIVIVFGFLCMYHILIQVKKFINYILLITRILKKLFFMMAEVD